MSYISGYISSCVIAGPQNIQNLLDAPVPEMSSECKIRFC